MLNQLPDELISAIVTDLQHVDLKSLSLVSYRLRGVVLPFLFRSLKFNCPAEYGGQGAPLQQLQGLADSEPILSQVRELTLCGEEESIYACVGRKPTLEAYPFISYMLSLPFPNLRRISFTTLLLDGVFLQFLVNLATRRDTELDIIGCQLCVDTSPASTFKLRITTLTTERICTDEERDIIPQGTVYDIISASSCHLRRLSLASHFRDSIDWLLQTEFKSLRIFELDQWATVQYGIAPLSLSKLLRHLGSLEKLVLSSQLTLDPEALLEGASGPPLYDIIVASCQACHILLPNNVVTSLYCRPPVVDWQRDNNADHKRAIVPMIEEGLKQNRKPLHELRTTIPDQEGARTLASLASICSESLKSLDILTPLSVSQRLSWI
jgi:hypothetical protein